MAGAADHAPPGVDVFLVTGCTAGGIGWHLCAELAALGPRRARVYATARRAAAMAGLAERGCRLLELDVTDAGSVGAAVKAVLDEAGRIDGAPRLKSAVCMFCVKLLCWRKKRAGGGPRVSVCVCVAEKNCIPLVVCTAHAQTHNHHHHRPHHHHRRSARQQRRRRDPQAGARLHARRGAHPVRRQLPRRRRDVRRGAAGDGRAARGARVQRRQRPRLRDGAVHGPLRR